MKPEEHYSEATRIAAAAEAKQREPGQPFDPEPWLKAQVHATLALYRREPGLEYWIVTPDSGEAE